MAQFQTYKNPLTGQETNVPVGASPDVLANLATLGYEPITGESLSPTPEITPSPIEISPPSDISGLEFQPLKLTSQEEKQIPLEKELMEIESRLAGKPTFEQEQRTRFGVSEAEQALEDLGTQLKDLQRQQQLVPLAIQTESLGRGRTAGGVEPLEIGRRRALAYDALTTASLIDSAQGRLASAERKVREAVNQKYASDEARQNAILNNLKIIKQSPETTLQDRNRIAQQEAIINQRQNELAENKTRAKAILDWANKASAAMAEQGELSPENNLVLNEIKDLAENPTVENETEAFNLAAPFLRKKDTDLQKIGEDAAAAGAPLALVQEAMKTGDAIEASSMLANYLKAPGEVSPTEIVPGTILTKEQFQRVNTLSDNIRQDQNIKIFNDVRDSYQRIQSAAVAQSGVGDLTLLRSFAKLTDPTTGVREEEYRTMETAIGSLTALGVRVASGWWTGKKLTEEGRQEFLKMSNNLYQGHLRNYNQTLNFYTQQAIQSGIDPNFVIPKIVAPVLPPSSKTEILNRIVAGEVTTPKETKPTFSSFFDKFLNIFGLQTKK